MGRLLNLIIMKEIVFQTEYCILYPANTKLAGHFLKLTPSVLEMIIIHSFKNYPIGV